MHNLPLYFGKCEQCFKTLHPGANLLQLSMQTMHMNANCLISIRLDLGFLYHGGPFSITILFKTDQKINFK